MIYTKAELIEVFRTIGYNAHLNGSVFTNLTSADFKRMDKEMLYCPKCKSAVRILVRVSGTWACLKCNNASISSNYKKLRATIIVNDLIAYFGENITSEQLFDSDVIDGFIRFCDLEHSPWYYLAFMQLHEAIMEKELSMYKIVPFMAQKRARLDEIFKKEPKEKPTSNERKSETTA